MASIVRPAACALALTLACGPGTGQPSSDASPWGICSSAEWFGEYPRFNPLVAQTGIRWFRYFPEWNIIQPRAGEWNWTPADDFLADARANGIRVSGGFWYFAGWATPNGDSRTCPLKDMTAWSDYVTAAVTRYESDIRDWEVYNEFNGSFANSPDKPQDYADLVVAAYDAAKAASPQARIGMSCANFDLGFFNAAIKAGAGGHFDFVCVHPYENLGSLAEGGEDGYLSMAGSLRKMLADNGQRPDMPLWITEMGFQAPTGPDPEAEALQSDILVKGYVMALAQGFQRVCWFEARGPSYGRDSDHGIIRRDWSLRPCHTALKTMTDVLGDTPVYTGWLNLADGGYGFVFDGRNGPVLTAWSPNGAERSATLPADVDTMDVYGATSTLEAGDGLTLGASPVYVLGLPAAHVAEARANSGRPFPWGGDYANATEVSCSLAATNTDRGIAQVRQDTTVVVNLLDHSLRRSDRARPDAEGRYAYFRVDPMFADFGTRELEITVTARRAAADVSTSIDVCYESLTGYRGTGEWWEVPAGDEWSSHTWYVEDANFVGGWGWNFRTDIGGSPGDVVIKEVRVKKTPAAGD